MDEAMIRPCLNCGEPFEANAGCAKWCRECRRGVEHRRDIARGRTIDEWTRPGYKSMALFCDSYNSDSAPKTARRKAELTFSGREVSGEAARFTVGKTGG
jgi:hypothetical protein